MARSKGKKANVATMKDELAGSDNDESATTITVSEVKPSGEENTNNVKDGIAEELGIEGATQDGVAEAKETAIAVSECEITETEDVVAVSIDAPTNGKCTKEVVKVVEVEGTVATIVADGISHGVEKKAAKEGIVEGEEAANAEAEKLEEADMKVKAKNMKRASYKKVKRVQKKKSVAGGAAEDAAGKSKTAAAAVGSTSGTKTEDESVGEDNKGGDAKAENGLSSEDGKVKKVGKNEEAKADVHLGNASTKKSKKIKKKKGPFSAAATIGAPASNNANDVNKSKPHDEATGASPSKEEDEHGALGSKKKDEKKEGMGLIFMCSSKTKKDCYKYMVLGMPESKKEIVDKVYKGMILFLFDIDLRLMYGIYKAASPGGYNIEPKAFKLAFPSQVRFSVLYDCKPLAEEKFKAVIKKNYYSRNKFNCQLSPEQAKNLCKLFRKENGPSKLTQATERVGGAVEVQSPVRGKKRTRLVISISDVDRRKRRVENLSDSKIKRRPRPTEAKRRPAEGRRDPEHNRRRPTEDYRGLKRKWQPTVGGRDSEHKRVRHLDDTRDSQYRRLHLEDTQDNEYRRPLDTYERERYQPLPSPRPLETYERERYQPLPPPRPLETYERERYQPLPPPRQVALAPALPPSYTYERPVVADDYYYKREPVVELRDPYASYREPVGYRYMHTSSYGDPVAYQETTYPTRLSSAAYVAGPSANVYPSGSSSAVYAPGSASAGYSPGSASAGYAPGSVSAAYPPQNARLYRY